MISLSESFRNFVVSCSLAIGTPRRATGPPQQKRGGNVYRGPANLAMPKLGSLAASDVTVGSHTLSQVSRTQVPRFRSQLRGLERLGEKSPYRTFAATITDLPHSHIEGKDPSLGRGHPHSRPCCCMLANIFIMISGVSSG